MRAHVTPAPHCWNSPDALRAPGCDADLMHTLWEADVVVFKAHITTGPGGKVLDMFWIYDNRCKLPENHRCLRQGPDRRHMAAHG